MMEVLTFQDDFFERRVREATGIMEGPVTEEDALYVAKLDLSCVKEQDMNTLQMFINLEHLNVTLIEDQIKVLEHFPKLRTLCLDAYAQYDGLDFSIFTYLPNLEDLWISGGDVSDMELKNPEKLTSLKHLKALGFHEFGRVDLHFLEEMPWIEEFFCGYAGVVRHVDSIGKLISLKSLELVGFDVNNLNFLDNLPGNTVVSLCGMDVYAGIDVSGFERFVRFDMDGMTVNWEPIPDFSTEKTQHNR